MTAETFPEQGRGYLDHVRPDAGGKIAEALAFRISRDIIKEAAPRHSFLGSEAALIEKYGVSRAVFREAIRILEYLSMVTARRGPRGGIYVGDPDGSAVIASTAMFLEYERVEPSQLYSTRAVLELHAVSLATERLDAEGERRLWETLESERTKKPEEYIAHNDFHLTIGELSGNRPLSMFINVCQTLTAMHSIPVQEGVDGGTANEMAAEIGAAHRAIVEAMVARDALSAQRAMDDHLRVMLPWLR
ncbi:FadR/GntR family transcriptional regulator [Acrocarpospora pleiomorpha]|uniref:FadR/GntR family transcriptional regulator n=1 Tax=Acrocarpospora pleiomorpha TaxID=90975 RepID=UPI001479630C|nr:FCD domain-containing protein [Acrocarpospora pleiomorpha]